jgi:hypothetical protein
MDARSSRARTRTAACGHSTRYRSVTTTPRASEPHDLANQRLIRPIRSHGYAFFAPPIARRARRPRTLKSATQLRRRTTRRDSSPARFTNSTSRLCLVSLSDQLSADSSSQSTPHAMPRARACAVTRVYDHGSTGFGNDQRKSKNNTSPPRLCSGTAAAAAAAAKAAAVRNH